MSISGLDKRSDNNELRSNTRSGALVAKQKPLHLFTKPHQRTREDNLHRSIETWEGFITFLKDSR